MGLFEAVQADLFEFMGLKHPPQKKEQNPSASKKLETLEDLNLPFEIIRRPYAKGLSFVVTHKGVLKITANRSLKEKEIVKLVYPHKDWILSQHLNREKTKTRFPQKKWQSGETFLWQGRPFTMTLTPSETKRPFIRFMSESFEYFYPRTWQELSERDFHEKLHTAFLKFFKQKASEILNEKVNHWSEQMNLHPKSVTYRNQKSRWGSCSSQGRINLNWKLACFEEEIQNYVIVHELAHLEHQNHSKKFWALVFQYYPDHKRASETLNQKAFEADCFLPESELYDFNPYF